MSNVTSKQDNTQRAVITIGYNNYVLDLTKAVEVLKLMDGAEVLASKYDKDAKVDNAYIDRVVDSHLRIMSAVDYHKAKMFGDVLKQEREI